MTARVVIDNHNQLQNRGNLTHAELDEIVLEGTTPSDRTVNIPSLVLANTFQDDVTIQGDLAVTGTGALDDIATVNDATVGRNALIQGDLTVMGEITHMGGATSIDMSTMLVEDVVIFLGQGATAEAAAGDRGIVFARNSDNNHCFYWDDSESEFRIAKLPMELLDGATPAIFPAADPEDFQRLHVGSLLSVGDAIISGGITGAALDISGRSTLASIIADDITFSSIISGPTMEVQDITTNTIIATDMTTVGLTASGNITATGVIATAASIDDALVANDLNVQGNLIISSLLANDSEQFIVAGRGIDINADPVTGQLEVSSPLGGKIKFVKEIEAYADAGEAIAIDDNLNPDSYAYDEDFWDVYVNGMLQIGGPGKDFVFNENLKIIFTFDIEPNDVIVVSVMH